MSGSQEMSGQSPKVIEKAHAHAARYRHWNDVTCHRFLLVMV